MNGSTNRSDKIGYSRTSQVISGPTEPLINQSIELDESTSIDRVKHLVFDQKVNCFKKNLIFVT